MFSITLSRRWIGLVAALVLAIALAIPAFSATPARAATPEPCDIYASGGTPCEAAYSTTRALYAAYDGALYQVRRASDNTTTNIDPLSAGGAANAALMLATAGLATAYAPRGVRVVGINPGLTDTDRVAEGMSAGARLAGITADEARARAVAKIPFGRMASADEVADVVVFLASARASYVTGVNISMDGATVASVV